MTTQTKIKIKKLTRKFFCSIYSSAEKMRRVDPIQFEVIFHDWKRLRTKGVINS